MVASIINSQVQVIYSFIVFIVIPEIIDYSFQLVNTMLKSIIFIALISYTGAFLSFLAMLKWIQISQDRDNHIKK